MADFENIRAAKNELALASLHLAVLFAPISSEPISTLEDTATGDLISLDDYTSAGIIEKGAGVNIGNDDTSTDIEAYGDGDPVRTIINKRMVSFQTNFLETNYQTLEKFWGTSLSNVTPTSYGGVVIEAPTLPKSIYYRCILLGQDDVNGLDLFPYWIMPRVKLDSVDSQNLQDDGTIAYNMTFKAFRDSNLGFSVAQGFTGPGWSHLVSRAGFAPTPTALVTTGTPGLSITATAGAGHTTQLKVMGDNGINYTPLCSFTSSLPAKATVSSSGLVTGVSAGSATVSVSYLPAGESESLTSSASITVT
jgi:hypothetical protein